MSYYTRLLPPVPEDCPLPMGMRGEAFTKPTHTAVLMKASHVYPSVGKPVLPDVKELTERFFRRRKFRPDPQGTNLMFAFMAQHFTHQFFKTNLKVQAGFTLASGHGVRYILTFYIQQPGNARKLLNNKLSIYIEICYCGL